MSNDYVKHAFIDFGTVSTGDSLIRKLEVVNNMSRLQRFTITRESFTSPLECTFRADILNSMVDPGDKLTLQIEYNPVVPFAMAFDYFNVLNEKGEAYIKIGVTGKSLGPTLGLSSKKLLFISSSADKVVYKTIELTNVCSVKAIFQFDIDENNVFKVDKMHGSIEEDKHTYVQIAFDPPGPGTYSHQLYCLIHYQSPILIDLVGICNYVQDFNIRDVTLVPYLNDDCHLGGFEGYINDITNITSNPAPLTLSVTYIDFGQSSVKGNKTIPCSVCVTNHIEKDVLLEWSRDEEKHFSLEPNSSVIPAGQSALFQAFFRPTEQECLYARELTARVYWEEEIKTRSKKDMFLPIILSIKMMGHTFLPSTRSWMLQFKCPEKIIMPVSVPSTPVYTTFIIRRFGSLPLMFKFTSPCVSNYVVKPMQGLITGEYQIIVVQFNPNDTEKTYAERWALHFNGSLQHAMNVDFIGNVELPTLIIGKDNVVVFPPTHLFTEQKVRVTLRNTSGHSVAYHFISPKDNPTVRVTEIYGDIAPYEVKLCTFIFLPIRTGKCTSVMLCETCALRECIRPFGTIHDTIIQVYGDCEYTELVSFPSEIQCGRMICDHSETVSFYIFNFSYSKQYIRLKYSRRSTGSVVQIYPAYVLVPPRDKAQITVRIIAKEVGANDVHILYFVRKHSESKTRISAKKRTCVIRYCGVYPIFQIQDIEYIGGGPVFSKISIWKMLNINRINELLRSMSTGDKEEVKMFLPHAPLGSRPLYIYLLLENESVEISDWSLKRRKMCSCGLVRHDETISQKLFRYDCPHRIVFTITPTSGSLCQQERTVWNIMVRYDRLGVTEVAYILRLSNNREIQLNAQVVTLYPQNNAPSTFTRILTLQDIFIGDLYPVIQGYWLYNNCDGPAVYNIDTDALKHFNELHHHVEIISCLNPSGELQPKTSYPLLFKFKPIQHVQYDIKVPMCLGSAWYQLHITGGGSVNNEPYLSAMRSKMPEWACLQLVDIPVKFSTDHLLVSPFCTNSSAERTFLLSNYSQDVIGFRWSPFNLTDMIKCSVSPARGKISPGEIITFKLHIRSMSESLLLTINMTCEIHNLSEREDYDMCLRIQRSLREKIEEEFVITETGLVKPDLDLRMPRKPFPTYRVLSVTCHVVNVLDLDAKIDVHEQQKLIPSDLYDEPKEETVTKFIAHDISIIKEVLERFIYDVVYAKHFLLDLKDMRLVGGMKYCAILKQKAIKAHRGPVSQLKMHEYAIAIFCKLLLKSLGWDHEKQT